MRPGVHRERAVVSWLSAGTLAAFARPLTWPAIRMLCAEKSKRWWTIAIADAEERGLVTFNHATKAWHLTDAGRAHTRGIS